MSTTTRRVRVAKKGREAGSKSQAHPKGLAIRRDAQEFAPRTPAAAASMRARLGLTQARFARLLPVSVRSLATLESGTAATEAVARRLTELERLTDALLEVIQEKSLGQWLQTPNPAFDGLAPLEIIERGQTDRLWEMIYFLRSGVAS